MKKWRFILFSAMAPLFFAGGADAAPPTRNELLAKLYSSTRSADAKPISSARIILSGKPQLEYLRKGGMSLLKSDGKPSVIFDGKRCWNNGMVGGNDDTWIFQLLFALRPAPELFGNLKLFPRPEAGTLYTLLGRRDRYLTTALIVVDSASGLIESVTILRDGTTRRFQPSEFRRESGRRIPGRLLIDGAEYRVDEIEWNLPLSDALFQIPADPASTAD